MTRGRESDLASFPGATIGLLGDGVSLVMFVGAIGRLRDVLMMALVASLRFRPMA